MIIRSFIFAASIFTLLACQSPAPKPVNLNPGTPVSSIISRYGNPGSVTQDQQGVYYSWQLSAVRLAENRNRSAVATSSRGGISGNSSYNPQVVRVFCKLDITTDHNQLITGWSAEGGGCRQILFNQL